MSAAPQDAAATPSIAAGGTAHPEEDQTAQHIAALAQLAQKVREEPGIQPIAPMQINFPVPANVARARALAAAMRARQLTGQG